MRYSLRFGRVARPAEYESIKFEYEQEYDDSETPREAAFDDLRNFVYKKLEEEMSKSAEKYVSAAEEAAEKPKEEKKPKAPAGEKPKEGEPLEYYYPQIEKLPWQAFKEKRDARPDEAAWIFTDTPGAEAVVDQIRREGAIFVRMNQRRFLCKLSGKEEQFINRIPQDMKEGT